MKPWTRRADVWRQADGEWRAGFPDEAQDARDRRKPMTKREQPDGGFIRRPTHREAMAVALSAVGPAPEKEK